MSTLAPDHPRAAGIEFRDEAMVVSLEDGRVIVVPLEWFPRLRDATADQRADWRLVAPRPMLR